MPILHRTDISKEGYKIDTSDEITIQRLEERGYRLVSAQAGSEHAIEARKQLIASRFGIKDPEAIIVNNIDAIRTGTHEGVDLTLFYVQESAYSATVIREARARRNENKSGVRV